MAMQATQADTRVESLKQSILQKSQILGSFHPEVIAEMGKLSALLLANQEHARAERTNLRALELVLGSDSESALLPRLLRVRGQILKETGRSAEAACVYRTQWALQYRHSCTKPAGVPLN